MGESGFSSNHEKAFLSYISNLTKACDGLDNLQVSIYLLEKEKFIYSNCALEKTTGVSCKKLLNGGWGYWYTLVNVDEVKLVMRGIEGFFSNPYFHEPFILKYHIVNGNGAVFFLRHEILLNQIGKRIVAINYFFDISEKEKIEKYIFATENKKTSFSKNRTNLISPREKEVLKLVAEGFSSKQIADQLFISNHTAISHRKSLIEKFNVKNTAQLIKRAAYNIELW